MRSHWLHNPENGNRKMAKRGSKELNEHYEKRNRKTERKSEREKKIYKIVLLLSWVVPFIHIYDTIDARYLHSSTFPQNNRREMAFKPMKMNKSNLIDQNDSISRKYLGIIKLWRNIENSHKMARFSYLLSVFFLQISIQKEDARLEMSSRLHFLAPLCFTEI